MGETRSAVGAPSARSRVIISHLSKCGVNGRQEREVDRLHRVMPQNRLLGSVKRAARAEGSVDRRHSSCSYAVQARFGHCARVEQLGTRSDPSQRIHGFKGIQVFWTREEPGQTIRHANAASGVRVFEMKRERTGDGHPSPRILEQRTSCSPPMSLASTEMVRWNRL
ncbi:unnamed protein product [Mycena citricolor]|uniref:Uncharacterized protein n=1 Tax=Mycena citricolor TaxID=2018698 RepID=A0AAD2HP11_9AGAR|nr:unnamed protein product [Mycena citricolor]